MRDAAIHIRNVPEDIRAKVLADAESRNTSVNDVLGEILSTRYGLAWEPTGYRYTASKSEQWFIRMPAVLKHTIQAHADAIGGKQTGCVLLALAQHYNLDAPTTKTRRPPPDSQLAADVMAEIRRRVDAGESIRALEREYGLPRMTLNRALRREEAAN
jgi:hypothetical protein